MSADLLLLADSQLLFRKDAASELHEFFDGRFDDRPLLVYLGAANNHAEEFFELACQGVDVLLGQRVRAMRVTEVEQLPEYTVDIVVLAGGNVSKGWQWLQQPKVLAWLNDCYQHSELIIGVSAGAIHMARGCDPELPAADVSAQTYLNWYPAFVAVHEEEQGWPSLTSVAKQQPMWPQVGLPMGSGILQHDDWCLSVGQGAFLYLAMVDGHEPLPSLKRNKR